MQTADPAVHDPDSNAADAAPGAQQFCTFTVDGLLFGVDVRQVQEVIRYQPMTPVPTAPPTIAGLINLRGQIVTAIDLRRRMALPDRPAGRLPMNVVVRTEEGAVSLLVDEIGDVIDADGTPDSPPSTGGPAMALVRCVHTLKDRLLLVLDTDKAVAAD